MKKILFLFSCLLACLAASASNIDKVAALQAAKRFALAEGLRMQFNAEPYEYRESAQAQPRLYVYEGAAGAGFVIVSASDCTDAVLGYSETSQFDPVDIPSSLKGWLEGMSRQVGLADAQGLAQQKAEVYNPAIQPMLSTRWNQGEPYNQYTPTVGGEKTPTGCMATAVAQVMYYHRWPQNATTAIPAYTTGTHHINRPALPATTFEWNAMQNAYNASATNGEPVARLMNYVGQALKMDFAPGGSGATHYYLPNALKEYFGYTSTTKIIERSGYSISQWDELIYNELVNNRPVLYMGYTPNWEGHAFVCDGYDGAGFYHINWGWGGISDGYFRLSVLNPGNTTSAGAASTDDGFTNGQVIVAGIQAAGPDNILQIWPLKSYTYNSATNKLKASISTVAGGTYEICLAEIDGTGTVTPVTSTVERMFYANSSSSAEFSIASLPAGSYSLYVALRKKGTDEWMRVGGRSQYAEVEVGGGGSLSVIMHPIKDISVVNAGFPRTVISGMAARLDVDVRNNADDYDGNLYVFLGQDGVKTQDCGSINVAMLAGEECTFSTSVVPATTNNLSVFIASDDKCTDVLFEHTFYKYSIAIESSEVQWDPVSVTVTLKNNTPIDYKNSILTSIYQVGKTKALGTLTNDVEIPADGTCDIVLTLNFDKTKKYYLTFQHLSSELSSTKKTVEGRVDVFYDESAGIALPAAGHDADAPVYNLAGQRVAPNYRGIVIKNGVKVLNK